MSNTDPKEWRRVSRAANGTLTVTVTLQDENLTSKWSTKTYRGHVAEAVAEDRKYALELLADLRGEG